MTDANTAYENTLSDPGLPKGTSLSGDQFTITRRLSAGGFGITYLAEDNTLGRTIVIKECYPDDICLRTGNNVIVRNAAQMNQFRSIVDMFMREARSLAKLRHPNIVGVHRAFEENDTAYMALDLIDGHDLLDILEANADNQFPPERVKDILLQLLQAIETIHDHDLLHRDISPDNIIIEKTGTPVLIDFGAARGDASRRTRAISAMLVVKDGYSPQEFYMAGSIQSPCSDLYALGATFYHILTGEAPANSQIRMAEIAGQNPDPCVPLAGRIDGYEPAFLEAIDKAMEIVPRNRLQSAAEWRALISDVTTQPATTAEAVTTAPPKAMTQDLDRLLTRLVAETNEEVEKSRPKTIEPVVEAVPEPPKAEKPDWLDEFNAESRRKEAMSQRIELEVVSDMDNALEYDSETGFTETDNTEDTSQVAKARQSQVAKVRQTKTRVIYAPQTVAPTPVPKPTHVAVSTHLESDDFEQERQALNAQFRDKAGLRASSTRTIYGETDAFAPPPAPSQMVGPLAKYLITGVVIGLGIILLYPNFL